jgi:Skp family chaperone for outer membrane proteins
LGREGKMDNEGTVFIKLDDYKDVVEIVGLAKEQIAKARAVLEKLESLKQQENSQIDGWQASLAEIEKKMEEIDRKLAETESK